MRTPSERTINPERRYVVAMGFTLGKYPAREVSLLQQSSRRNPADRIRVMEGESADLITTVRGRKHGKLECLAHGEWASALESNARAA